MFFVVELTELKNGTFVPGVFQYNTEREAFAAFYNTLSSKAADANVKYAYVEIKNQAGSPIRVDCIGKSSMVDTVN